MDGSPPAATSSLHRFTADQYYAMAAAGVLTEDMRVELIEGHVVDMSPIGTPHMVTVMRLTRSLVRLIDDRALVCVQGSLRVNEHSVPEPDLVLLRPEAEYHGTAPFRPTDVLLLIEVAESSLASDRGEKAPLYERNGIVEYWIVNLDDRVVEVHRRSNGERFTETTIVSGDLLAIGALPDLSVCVDDICPPRP